METNNFDPKQSIGLAYRSSLKSLAAEGLQLRNLSSFGSRWCLSDELVRTPLPEKQCGIFWALNSPDRRELLPNFHYKGRNKNTWLRVKIF